MKPFLSPVVLLLAVLSVGCAGTGTFDRGLDNVSDATAEISRVEVRAEDRPLIERLAAEIKAFLGAPYRWGGVTEEGVDCSGLVQTVFRRVYGLSLPRTTRDLYRTGIRLRGDPLRLGDLLFFRPPGKRNVSHVGIYLGQGKFVHASTSRGVVISSLQEKYYQKHFLGARRVLNEQAVRAIDD
jgi:cell wall-associated NlpC family hydrolase